MKDPKAKILIQQLRDSLSTESTVSSEGHSDEVISILSQLDDEVSDYEVKLSQAHTLTEKTEAGARVKSEFLATMSHEIRTPMNGILGVVDMLMDEDLTSEAVDNLKIIQTSSQNLLTIINDILDFSKIEAGKLDIEKYPVNLVQIIETCINIFKFPAQDKGLEILYDIDATLNGIALTDGGRLSQIINNLISNALKFTEKGHILIRARLKGGMGDQRIIQFSIIDTGMGIPLEQQSKLFNAFTQADSSTSRKYGGTGLGLAISKKLSELLGGSIGLRSRIGKGTEFYFTIKCKVEVSNDHLSEKLLFKDKKVFYFEGSKILGTALKNICNRWSLDTKVINKEKTIFTLLEKHPETSGILFDYHMLEDLDLHAIRQRLSEEFPDKSYPFVLTCSLANLPLVEDKAIFQYIIPKPFKMDGLKEVFCSLFDIDFVEIDLLANPSRPNRVDDLIFATELTDEEKNISVLVAEDNKLNQKIVHKMFDRMGLSVEVAEDGLDVLQRSAAKQYGLIFMDMQMPNLNGIETTEILVRRHNFNQRPLIIAMTANAMQSDRDSCLSSGMDDFLTKPLRMEDIIRMIKKWHIKIGTNPQGSTTPN